MIESNQPLTADDLVGDLPPVAGRKIIHTLTNSEIDAYVKMVDAEDAYNAVRDIVIADMGAAASRDFIGSMTGQINLTGAVFEPEIVNEFLKAYHNWMERKFAFWGAIRRGRDLWNCHLLVCAGWVIVNAGQKFKTK